jgi:hypothetical protein
MSSSDLPIFTLAAVIALWIVFGAVLSVLGA